MNDNEAKVNQARAALEEAEARTGKDSLETSYKLDDLAASLKENGQALDSANASARARTIRAAAFAKESERQEEQLGEVRADTSLTATGTLRILYKVALGAMLVLIGVAVFMPRRTLGTEIERELLGSFAAGTLIQLLLFPIKTLPRWVKYMLVVVAAGGLWAFLSGLDGDKPEYEQMNAPIEKMLKGGGLNVPQ